MTLIRTETRIIRPFIGLDAAESALSLAMLRQGSKLYPQGTILLPKAKLRERSFEFVPNVTSEQLIEACKEAGISGKDATYLVYANSRTLRKSTIIYELELTKSSQVPEFIDLEGHDEDDLNKYVFLDSAGFQLCSALVLNKDVQEKSLRVHRVGTFLARAVFNIKPEEDLSNFAPEALTDILKSDFRLPKNAMTYVNVLENILDSEDLSESVTVYLDSEILNLLLIDENDGASKLLQSNLAIQTVQSIMNGITSALNQSGLDHTELSENSGAARLLSQLSSDLQISVDEIVEISTKDQARFHSYLEEKFSIQNLVESLLKGSN